MASELSLIIGEMKQRLEEYNKILDKFGSLEEALEAEKVTHCWECAMWKPEKGICNKPYESMRARCPDEYCSDGRYYRKSDEAMKERLAEIADKFDRVNPISPKELRAALERAEKEQKWAVSEEED